MRAIVTLKYGKTYNFGGHVFTESPSYVTEQKLIDQLKKIGALKVVVKQDAPPPAPPVPPKVEKPKTEQPADPSIEEVLEAEMPAPEPKEPPAPEVKNRWKRVKKVSQ